MIRLLIACLAHEINRAYCLALGDTTQVAWADAPEHVKKSALAGVDMHLANPDATPEQSHESWLEHKLADGWRYGEVKDAAAKVHPCCLPYDELPPEQKAKDYLFRAAVHAANAMLKEHALTMAPVETAGAGAKSGGVVVRYIGRREQWQDRLYGSGLSFRTGQVRAVPGGLARQLLRHADMFEPVEQAGTDGETVPVIDDDTEQLLANAQQKQADERTEQVELQDLRDTIGRMPKAALMEYARNNYRQELDSKLKVDDMRAAVIGMVDQFGAV